MPLPDYSGLNPAFYKFNHYGPAAQPRILANAQRLMMLTPVSNNPSRSQFQQGYTDPIQMFAASNSWQSPSGQMSVGSVPMQPSLRFASPQSLKFPTKMPWQT